jgi:hypothetical protein
MIQGLACGWNQHSGLGRLSPQEIDPRDKRQQFEILTASRSLEFGWDWGKGGQGPEKRSRTDSWSFRLSAVDDIVGGKTQNVIP